MVIPGWEVLARQWSEVLLSMSLQGAIVGAAALLYVVCFHRAPAVFRYGVLLVALAKFVMPPVWPISIGLFSGLPLGDFDRSATLAKSGFIEQPRAPEWIPGSNVATQERGESSATGSVDDRTFNGHKQSTAATKWRTEIPPSRILWTNWRLQVAGIHVVGVVIGSVLLASKWRWLQRCLRSQKPLDPKTLATYRETAMFLGIKQIPQAVFTGDPLPAFSLGFLRPTIVLGRDTAGLSPERLRLVMAHELAHVRRRDLWVNWLQILVGVCFWFHPMVWILNRQLRRVREKCCDDMVMSLSGVNGRDYADCLLSISRRRTAAAMLASPLSLPMSGVRHPLARRLQRILDSNVSRVAGLTRPHWCVIGLLAIAVLPGVRGDQSIAQPPQAAFVESGPPAAAPEQDPRNAPDEPNKLSPWPGALRVRVTSNIGEAISKAIVRLHEDDQVRHETRTDSFGIAIVPIDNKSTPAYRSLSAHSDGYVTTQIDWWPRYSPGGEPGGELTFVLTPGTSVGGVLVDQDAKPVAGAKVIGSLRSPGSAGVPYPSSLDLVAESDASGRWSFPDLPTDVRELGLRVIHHEFISDPEGVDGRIVSGTDLPVAIRGQLEYVLRKGRTISVRVIDESGDPVEGAACQLGMLLHQHVDSPRSDANGRLDFRQCDSRIGEVIVWKRGLAPERITIPQTEDDVSREVQLRTGKRVVFQLVDPDGHPLAGVRVVPMQWRGMFNCLAVQSFAFEADDDRCLTNSAGIWEWMAAPADAIIYSFSKDDMYELERESYVPRDEPYRITMSPRRVVTGKVVDGETGRPVTVFTVGTVRKLFGEDGPWDWTGSWTKGENGSYSLPIEESDADITIRAWSSEHAPAYSQLLHVGKENEPVDFTLQPSPRFEGRVVDDHGRPVANAVVALDWVNRDPPLQPNGDLGASPSASTSRSKRTTASGEFSFPTFDYEFWIAVSSDVGFACCRYAPGTAYTAAERTMTLKPWGRIQGKISSQDPATPSEVVIVSGRLLDDSQVALRPRSVDYHVRLVPDSAGQFYCDRVPGETDVAVYRSVMVWRGAFGHEVRGAGVTFHVDPGSARSIVLGDRGTTVTGRVRFTGDEKVDWRGELGRLQRSGIASDAVPPPPEDAGITRESPMSFIVEADGRFRIHSVLPGKYTLHISAAAPRTEPYAEPEKLGKVIEEFQVPAELEGQSMDLGELSVELARP